LSATIRKSLTNDSGAITQFEPDPIGRIVMGRGRDAADVAMSTAFGMANLKRFVVVTDENVQAA